MEKLIKLFSKTHKQDHQSSPPDEDGDLILSQAIQIQNQNANAGYTDKSMVFMDTRCWRYLSSHFRVLMEQTKSEYVLDSYKDREQDFELWKTKKYNLYLNKRLYMETLESHGEIEAMEAVFREMADPIKTASIRFLLPNSPMWSSMDFICLDGQVHLVSARLLYTVVVQHIPDDVLTPSLYRSSSFYHISEQRQTLASELKEKLIQAMGNKTHSIKLTMSNKGILVNGLSVNQQESELQQAALMTIPMVGINIEEMISMLNLDKNPGFKKRIVTHDQRVVGTALSRVYYNIINTPRPSDKPPTEGVFSNVDMNFIEDLDDENFKHTLLMLCYQVIVSNKAENVQLSSEVEKLLSNQDWSTTKKMVNSSSHFVMLAWEHMPTTNYDYIHIIGFEVSNASIANLGYNEMGHQFISDGVLYVSPYNSNRVYAYSSYAKNSFTKGSDWILGGVKYCKFNHKSYNYGACVSYTSKNFYEIIKEPNNEWAMLSIPYVNPDMLTTVGIPHITIKRMMLNKQLLNDMLARNLYGQMTYESLIEYGLSLSYIKYYRGSLPVNVKEIDTEMIRCHAYVAFVLQQRNELSTNAIITTITGGPLNRVAMAMTSGMVKFFFQQFSLNLSDQSIYKKIFKNLTTGLNIENKSKSLMSYWTNLEIFASSSDNFVLEEHGQYNCKHHPGLECDEDITKVECPCCHYLTGSKQFKSYCTHCSSSVSQEMELEDVKPMHLTDSKTSYSKLDSHVAEVEKEVYDYDELIKEEDEQENLIETNEIADVTDMSDEELSQLMYKDQAQFQETLTQQESKSTSEKTESSTNSIKSTLSDQDIDDALSWPSEESIFVDLDELKPWVGVEKIELLKDHKTVLNKHKIMSSIYFLPHGSFSANLKHFKIIKHNKMPDQSCGKSALKHYLNIKLSEQWFYDTINSAEPLTMTQLSTCFEKFLINHGFIVGENIIFKTVVDSSLYAIVEYESRDSLMGHWNCAQIEQIEQFGELFMVPFKLSENYRKTAKDLFKTEYKILSLDQQIYVNKILCNTIEMAECIYPNLPKLIGDKYGNSDYNYLRSGNFCLNLQSHPVLQEFKSLLQGQITETEFIGYPDFTEHVSNEHKLRQLLKICLNNMHKVCSDNADYKTMISLEVYSNGNQVMADVSSTKLKSGDVIKLTDGTSQVLTMITVINNQMILPTRHMNPAAATINLKIPKLSVGSLIRKILAIVRVLNKPELIDIACQLLHNAKGINGIFGSGKTTAISDQIAALTQEKYLVVGKTRGSIKALKSKNQDIKAVSVEYQSFTNEKCEILIIDEASLIADWELPLLIAKETKQLYIYGDRFQIQPGMYDITIGAISKSNLLTKCGPYVQHINYTYRIGQPLLNQLSLALNETLTTRATHQTTFEIVNMEHFDKEKAIDIMRNNDLCLVFYNEHLKTLQNYALEFALHSRIVLLSTVESAQGLEASRVAVFQQKFKNAEIHEVTQFCISAASRTVNHLTWVNVNTSNKSKELWKLLSMEKIGNWLTTRLFDEQQTQVTMMNNGVPIVGTEVPVESLLEKDDEAMNEEMLLKQLEYYSSNRRPINNCKFENIDINILRYMIETKAAKYGAQSTVEFSNEAIKITISAYIVTKWVKIEKDMTITSNLNQCDHRDLELTIHNVFGDKVINSLKKKKFNLRASKVVPKNLHNSIRILAHLAKISEFMGHALQFTYKLEDYTVRTIKGCSACTGLKIEHGKDGLLNIGPDYSMHATRYSDVDIEDVKLFQDLLNAKPKECVNILDGKVNLNNDLYSNLIVSERIHSFVKSGILKTLNGSALMHADEEKNQAIVLQNELETNGKFIGKLDGYSNVSNWPSLYKTENNNLIVKLRNKTLEYSSQPADPSSSKSNWFGLVNHNATNLVHYTKEIQRKLVSTSFFYDMEDFKTYSAYSVLSRVRNQLIGADSFSALLKPISWHENQKNSSVTDKLRDKMSKLYFTKLRILDRVFYVPTEVHNYLHDVYKLGHRSAPTFGASQADPNICAADVAVFNMVVNSGENFKYICECPYVSYSCNEIYKVTLPWWESPLSMNQAQATSTLRTMLLIHLQNNEHKDGDNNANSETTELPTSNKEIYDFMELKECKYYTPDTDIHKQPVMIGPSILSLNERDIQNIAIMCSDLYFWVPNLEYKNVLHLANSRLTIPKPAWFKLEGGHVKIDGVKHTLLAWKSLADITIYKLVKSHVVYATKQNLRSNKIQVNMPVMFINPGEVIENQSILGAVRTTVDVDIISALQKRLLRPQTSFEDLLVHARTLYHSDRYSSITIHRSVLSTAAEAKNCAIIAYLSTYTEQQALKLFVTQPENAKSITIQTLKDGLTNLFSEMFSSLELKVDNGQFDQKKFIADITDNPYLKDILVNFIDELNKVKLMSLKPTRQLRTGKMSIFNHLAEAYKWFRMPNNDFLVQNHKPEQSLNPECRNVCIWFFGTRGDSDFGEIVANNISYNHLTLICNSDLVEHHKAKYRTKPHVTIYDAGISSDDVFAMWQNNDLGILKKLKLKEIANLGPFDDLLVNDFNYIAQYLIKSNLLVKFKYIDTSIMHPLGKLAIQAFEQYCKLLPKSIGAVTYIRELQMVRHVTLEYKNMSTQPNSLKICPLTRGLAFNNCVIVYHKFLSERGFDILRNLSKTNRVIVVSETEIEGLETVKSVNFNECQEVILLHHCGIGITSLLLENNFRNVALPIAGDQFNNGKSLSMRTNCILIKNEEEIGQALEEVKIIENEHIVKYKEIEINLEEKHCFNILQHNDYIINANPLHSLIIGARERLLGRAGFYTTIVDEYRCDEITEITYLFGMDDNLVWTVGHSGNIYAICKSPDYNWQLLNVSMWLINVPSANTAAVFSGTEIPNGFYLQEDQILEKADTGTYECLECDMPTASDFRTLCPTCTLSKGVVSVSEIDDSKLVQTTSFMVDYTCNCGTNTIFETSRLITLCTCGKLIQRRHHVMMDSATEMEPSTTIRLTNKSFTAIKLENGWRITLSQIQPRKMIKRIDTVNRTEPMLNYDDFIDDKVLEVANVNDELFQNVEVYNTTHPNPVDINRVWINSTNEFMKKLTMGRDWMSNDLHFTSSVYLNPVKLSDSQIKFILYVKEVLKQIPSAVNNIGVYALEPGSIERSFSEFDDYSIYFSSKKLSHLEKEKEKCLWIDTKQSLGRINACVRLLPYLIGPAKTYFMRGGRFGPAGFAMEEILYHTKEKDASGTFCSFTSFYMDGAKLTTKPSINNILEIISILLNYGSIYGVDEGICYLLPKMLLYHGSSGSYSNVAKAMNTNCRLSQWIKSCQHRKVPDISGTKYKTPAYLSERAWWDITGFNKAMKLVNPDFIPRDPNSPSHSDEAALFEIWSKAVINKTTEKVENAEIQQVNGNNESFLVKLPSTNVRFNPDGDSYCVKKCVEYMKMQMDQNIQNGRVLNMFHKYESVDSTLKKLKLENISCTIKIMRAESVEYVYVDGQGPTFAATLEINKDQQGHMIINELSEEDMVVKELQDVRTDTDTIYRTFAKDYDLDELLVEMESMQIDALIRQLDNITLAKLEKIQSEKDVNEGGFYILTNISNEQISLLYKRDGEIISSQDLRGLQFGVNYNDLKKLKSRKADIIPVEATDSKDFKVEQKHINEDETTKNQSTATIQDASRETESIKKDEVQRTDALEIFDFEQLPSEALGTKIENVVEDSDSFKTIASEAEKVFTLANGELMSIPTIDYENIKTFKKRGSLKLMDKTLSEETNNSRDKIKKLWRKVKAHVITVDLLTYLATQHMGEREFNSRSETHEWEEFQRQCELPPLYYTEMGEEMYSLQFNMRSEIFNSLCSMTEIPKFLEMEEPEGNLLKEICKINTIIVFHWEWKKESYEPMSLISIKDAVLIELTRKELLELGFIEGWNMESLPIQPSYEFKIIKTKPKRKLSNFQFNSVVYLTTIELNLSGYGALPEEPEEMDIGTINPLSWQNIKLGTNKGPDFHFASEPPTTSWKQSEMQLSKYQLTCLDSLSLLGGKVKRLINKMPLTTAEDKSYTIDYYLLDTSLIQNEFCDIPIKLVPQPKTIYVYEDEHGMLETQIPLPATDIGLRVRQQPTAIKEFVKLKLTEYPEQAVPAYTKHMLSSTKAVANLFGSKVEYRNYRIAPKDEDEGRRLIDYCYGPGSLDKIATFRKQELWYDIEDLLQWLKQRPDRNKITSELIKVIEEGMAMHPMNIVNIHNKIEARLKDVLLNEEALSRAPTNDIHATKIRQIVWQKKGLTSIFAPVFTRAKQRFKDLLAGGKVLYVDGYTPWQLNKKFNTIPWEENLWFYEDDLTAQDKQTDRISINFEMWWYVNHLGVSPILVNLWQEAHNHWMGKNHEVRILEDAMRQTGQATTALGNALTNLISKSRTVERYYNSIKLMTILGDDNLIIMDEEPDLKVSIEEAAIYYNMENKPSKSKCGGGFLRMQAYITKEKTIGLGPDIVRLRRRFELTNNNSGTDIKNLENRAENYKHMLGNVNGNFGEEFPMWYDYQEIRKSLAHKYTCTEAEIDNNTALLTQMILENKAEKFSKLMFATLENKQFKT